MPSTTVSTVVRGQLAHPADRDAAAAAAAIRVVDLDARHLGVELFEIGGVVPLELFGAHDARHHRHVDQALGRLARRDQHFLQGDPLVGGVRRRGGVCGRLRRHRRRPEPRPEGEEEAQR
jgi:hypothetical protein